MKEKKKQILTDNHQMLLSSFYVSLENAFAIILQCYTFILLRLTVVFNHFSLDPIFDDTNGLIGTLCVFSFILLLLSAHYLGYPKAYHMN